MWDALFPVTPGADPTFRTCYSHDTRGLLASLRYPATESCGTATPYTATVKYRYEYGELKGMNDSRRNPLPIPTDPNSWRLIDGVTYNNAGGLQALSYANGVDITITPDLMYRPSRIKVQGPGSGPNYTYLDTGIYKYDGVGNIIAIGEDEYTYDFIGRLKTALVHHEVDNNSEEVYDLTYTYDDFGNMTREDRVVAPGGASAKIFNVSEFTNRIQNMGDPNQPFLFDARGNLRRDETQRYHFDERNRLVAVKKEISAWPVGNYTYDAGGLRIMKADPVTGQRTFFVRDGSGNILSEFTPSGAGLSEGFWQKDYFYALGHVIGHAEEDRPRPVEGLASSVSISANQATVTLNWLPNEEPALTGYLVYRKDPNGAGWELASSLSSPITGTSWVDPVTFPDTAWRFYRVAALAGSHEGVTSRSIRVDPGTTLTDPSGLTARSTETSIVLNWNPLFEDVDGLVAEPTTTFIGYNVYRKDDPNSAVWDLLNPTPLRLRRFYDLGVEEGSDYIYMLRGVDSLGNETQGQVTTAATPLDLPNAPAGVQAFSSGNAGQIFVRWWPNGEGDLTGYRVYHLETDPNTQQPRWVVKTTVSPTVTEVYIGNLAQGQEHAFAVSAADPFGESPLSASASARPRVSFPQAPVVTRAEDRLAWQSGSVVFEFSLPVEELEEMAEFRVYRKHQWLPDDQWSLVHVDPVVHPAWGDPPWHNGRYVDRWPYRCAVTQYMITGVRLDGEMIRDTLAPRLVRGTCSFRDVDAPVGGEVDGEAAEPVAPLVVLARDFGEPLRCVRGRGSADRGEARIAFGKPGSDPVEHPGAAEVEAVEVGQLGISGIGHDRGLEPGGGSAVRDAGEESREPCGVLFGWEHAPQKVGLRQAG